MWDVRNFECLFDLKIEVILSKTTKIFNSLTKIFQKNEINFCHLGFLKENNERFNVIISHKYMSIFDLDGNKLIDYQGYSGTINFSGHKFIDTYYDKKSAKNYIFMLNDNFELYSIDYQKKELYKKYYSHNKPKRIMTFFSFIFKESENFRILYNESKNLL